MAHQHIFSSGAWLMACFLASFFIMGFSEAKTATGTQDKQAILMGAWEQASGLATAMYGKTSEYVQSQGSLGNMVGVGAAGAAVVACTVYVASRCLDKEPYLFNNGKLGKLEAQSAFNTTKKNC